MQQNNYIAYPIIEIARIAVSFDLQHKGLWKVLFYDYILPKIQKVSNIIAVYGIIVFVENENEKGIKFYKSLGFEKANDDIQMAIGDSYNEECKLYVLKI